MKLTVYFDGVFWSGLVEYSDKKGYKAFRYVFGKEPKDEEVLDFIYFSLGRLLNRYDHLEGQNPISKAAKRKKNPKRLQREISKAKNKPAVSTKAQAAMQKMQDNLKKEKKTFSKQQRLAEKERRYQLKQKKHQQKRKGH
ncbi:YjdF family protein [Streptococcus sp. H31]|uniref:YjdF family protein n=1 Tax=Streptococcus huangxiaojuni TaxID=3237239 RepID=UPI0034A51E2B